MAPSMQRMTTVPRRRPSRSPMRDCTWSTMRWITPTSSASRRPAWVSRTPLGLRSMRVVCSRSSSLAICRLTAEGVTCRRSAAWRMEPHSAVSEK